MKFIRADEGDTRTLSFFALFPVTIDKETRWWEHVTVLQVYRYGYPKSRLDGDWYNLKFEDK